MQGLRFSEAGREAGGGGSGGNDPPCSGALLSVLLYRQMCMRSMSVIAFRGPQLAKLHSHLCTLDGQRN